MTNSLHSFSFYKTFVFLWLNICVGKFFNWFSFACEVAECGSEHFRCEDGQCISASWRCDGTKDCLDDSDEFGCRK